jgi:hypothetical protein
MIEKMSAYQRATGLKPIGVHRPAADTLLKGVSHRCVPCGGQGYFQVRAAWIWCEVCGGLGRVMTPKAQLLLQGRVAETFPDAVVGPPIVVEWPLARDSDR